MRHLLTSLFALVFVVSASSARAAVPERLSVNRALLDDVVATLAAQDDSNASVGTLLLPAMTDQMVAAKAGVPGGKRLGLGIQVGAPTAVTIKYMLSDSQGIVAGIGGGFAYNNGYGFAPGLSLHVDYLFTLASLVSNETLNLSVYAGPGVWLALFSRGYGFGMGYYYSNFGLFGVGARVPLGLSLVFGALPLELYLEFDPALFIFPGIDFGIGASLGFRFYF